MFRRQFTEVQDAWTLAHAIVEVREPLIVLDQDLRVVAASQSFRPVKALAKQLNAQVVTLSGASGTEVSVTHATFAAA
jgi:replicative DNA helicase